MESVRRTEASMSHTHDKLVALLAEESGLLSGIERSEVESLTVELEMLRVFLRTADERFQDEMLIVKLDWLKGLEFTAEAVEEVMELNILKLVQQRRHRHGFISLLGRLSTRRRLSSHIQTMKSWLCEVIYRGQGYGIVPPVLNSIAADWNGARLLLPLSRGNIVGIYSEANELVQSLVGGPSRRSVISLVGLCGIGKTTLAKIAYDSKVVSGGFDCQAWITLSPSYKRDDLLRILVMRFGAQKNLDVGKVAEMGMEELIVTLREYLLSKRYLLVFDGVFSEEFWLSMKMSLPDSDKRSRVIMTTRSDRVATYCKGSSFDHVYRLKPLSAAMSWDLFCSRAFQYENDKNCPPELEALSHKFVDTCGGLPLAIMVLGDLLSMKEKTVLEWQRVLDSLIIHLLSDPHPSCASKILALSFRDLPYHLKMCFFYFSIFPQSFLIPNDKLFKLWIAEGFVEPIAGKTLEEVAEEYLNELIQRNLVQACDGFDGLEKLCRLNELIYEITRQKADECKFCLITNDNNSHFRGRSRRLSISNKNDENVLETIKDCRVRSAFISNLGVLSSSFVVALFKRCKLLTLLDFDNVPLDRLPEEVGNLFYLKYLSLKNTKVKTLPKSVGKLENLQTLDLRNSLLVELPIEINMLLNLRHLLASRYDNKIGFHSAQGVRFKEGIRNLENLQTLMYVEAHPSRFFPIWELEHLIKLRRLCISKLTTEVASAVCRYIMRMSNLESLSLHSMNDSEVLDIQNISSAPPTLRSLILKGQLQRFPNWISGLQTLSMLCLSLSRLANDPLSDTSALPNLVSLCLYRAYEGNQLRFQCGGFQKLKLLVLRDLQGLEVVEIEEGALPLLEELRIGPSPLLNEVPSSIQHLRSLKVLAFYDMPNEFVLSMQPGGGSDYVKIGHVPSVHFCYRVQGRSYALYELGDSKLLDRLQGLATNIVNDTVQDDLQLSFCYSDNGADSTSASFSRDRMSFSSDQFSCFTDDIVD